jgi:hypothetical protein
MIPLRNPQAQGHVIHHGFSLPRSLNLASPRHQVWFGLTILGFQLPSSRNILSDYVASRLRFRLLPQNFPPMDVVSRPHFQLHPRKSLYFVVSSRIYFQLLCFLHFTLFLYTKLTPPKER